MPEFEGFPQSTPQYFQSLAANNKREWFEENKSDFEQLVKEPALAFIRAMAPSVEAMKPPHKAEAKLNGSFRRVHRDTRFSKDKTPYNPRLHMIFWTGGHPTRSAAIHVVLSGRHFGIGAGHWGFEPEQLAAFRSAVKDPKIRADLEKAIDAAAKDGQALTEPHLKKIPKGLEEAGDLARYKGLVVKSSDEPLHPALFTSDCVSYVKERMNHCLPLQRWLLSHVYDH